MAERSRMYKNKDKDGEELRRRRIDQSVELRKNKKDDNLQKRRNIVMDELLSETSPLKENNKAQPETIDYDSLCIRMKSSDVKEMFSAVQMCRKILSRAKNPPIDEFFYRGVVTTLVSCLNSQDEHLVFESAWALTNIASGESKHTRGVVSGGAVPLLIRLLDSSGLNIAEQCVWALGNIAGDGSELRDLLIKEGVVEPLTRLLERCWDQSGIVGNIAWTMSNLCRNKEPAPPRHTVARLLPVLKRLLEYPADEVVQDVAWALSYASDAANDFIGDIINSGCVPLLVKLLGASKPSLVSPALRAVGNLVTGTDEQTQAVLNCGLLKYVIPLLSHPKPTIIKETAWMVSNITAGTPEQIQLVIDHNIIINILHVICTADFKSQKEACWAVSNFINGGTPVQIAYLMNNNVLEALTMMMTVSEPKIVTMVLESLKKLFEIARDFQQLEACCIAFESCGGIDRLEELQEHENERVYKASYEILDAFFSGPEGGDDNEQQAISNAAKQDEAENQIEFNPVASNNTTEFNF